MHTYFKRVTPNEDYSLSIVLENGCTLKYSMVQLVNQLRFTPLKNREVWLYLEVYPTHLEWNKGRFQVTLNIEEIIPDHYQHEEV